VIDFLVSGKLP
jgi:hypothetical protein